MERFFLLPSGDIISLCARKSHPRIWDKYCFDGEASKKFTGYCLGYPVAINTNNVVTFYIGRYVISTESDFEELK